MKNEQGARGKGQGAGVFHESHAPRPTSHAPTRGLTLVELLVTTSLMALVGGAAVSALAGGVRVWERAKALGTQEESVLVAARWIERDLHNVRHSTLVPFEGMYNSWSFGIADRRNRDDAQAPKELGRVGYFLQSHEHVLCRSFVPYQLMHEARLGSHCQSVLEGVSTIRVKYYGVDPERGSLGWSEHWKAVAPPLAVRVDVDPMGRTQEAPKHTFVISLALHQPSPFEEDETPHAPE